MATALKRTGVSSYTAVLAAKSVPTIWSDDTLLLRFIEENKTSTVFVISLGAIPVFKSLELWRTYDMQIPGKCIKQKTSEQIFGVQNHQQVTMKFACSVTVSKRSWPFAFPYKFQAWTALNQLEPNIFVDICGRVHSKQTIGMLSSLPKLTMVMSNSNLTQDVDFLGEHAHLHVKVGDVVALGGVRVSVYNEQRTLQTSFLSIIEVNPAARVDVTFEVAYEEDEPMRKAIKMSGPTPISVAQALESTSRLLRDVQAGSSPPVIEFTLLGHLQGIDSEFFDNDFPIVDSAQREIMCWRTSLSDPTGSIDVNVWDKSCCNLFSLTATGLRGLWEKGVDDAQCRDAILKQLNAQLPNVMRCICSTSVRKYGKDNAQHEVQVNINNLEVQEST